MSENTEKKSKSSALRDRVKSFLIAIAIVVVLKLFIIDATRVQGNSMLDTLHTGDVMLVNKVSKNFSDYKRGDIVILEAPDYPGRLYIKRVVGEPGDEISLEDGEVLVNGKVYEEDYVHAPATLQTSEFSDRVLGEDEYFVMGDNRLPNASNDSRNFGSLSKDQIVGHAFFRIYPFSDMGRVDR